ncbi:MAG: response regulator [Oscillospiraceae bacterium]|nr:response regulator [Oscillospiraceae bacterium]
MSKQWLKDHSILLCITIGFLIIISVTFFTFIKMDKELDTENQETLREVSNLYISSSAQQTASHVQLYFESRFEIIDQVLSKAVEMKDKESSVEYLQNELSSGMFYIAMIKADGTFERIRGDKDFHPYDSKHFWDTMDLGNNKVFLIADDNNNKAGGMVLNRDFTLGGQSYCGIICGFTLDSLNNILDLSFGEGNLTYSFVIRRADSAFVIRSEGDFRMTYFERVKALYREYNGKTADDYIAGLSEAMKQNVPYSETFMMDDGLRMLYATPMYYSDWYLITFIRYDEVNSILGDNNKRSDDIFTYHTAILAAIILAVFISYVILSYNQIQKTKKSENKALLASKAKSDFLANMSHDIRTPMNAIVGMTEIARSHIDDQTRVEDCLNKIALSGRHLIFLINDVLDMSKIENGKMTLTLSQTTLREILENIVMIIQPQVKNKQHKFDIYAQNIISENIRCDTLRLNQILINLVSNAVKYTPDNGEISLTVIQEASPKGEGYVRTHFIVKDNGIGMSEDFVKVVFESFEREDRKRTTKEEGTGLGLAITKYLIDAMGGTVEVSSKLNEGSEFHVAIDFEKSDDNGDMKLHGLSVLVIDDNEDQCITATETLRELGAEAEYLLDGENAIEKIQSNPDKFDIILIDWQMPKIDGIEASRAIRERTGNSTPIILISAYDCSEFEKSIKDAGINGILLKPLFKSTLYYGIQEHINKKAVDTSDEPNDNSFLGERILLAEDNELNGEIAVEMLSSAGLTVDWVTNGQKCVEKFLESKPGYYKAIIMDIRMPVMNGYEATAEIRSTGRPDCDIPIIAATADAFADDVARAKECGMNAHIAKPIDTQMLLSVLSKYCN